jgi:hypothetical protein
VEDNLQPPDQEELEKAVRDLFKDGDIKQTSRHSRIPYGSLTKQLNAGDPTESIPYEFLMLLYGAEKAKAGLGDALWALISRMRPRRVDKVGCAGALDAAYHNLKAVLAEREDGLCDAEKVEDAKSRLAEAVAHVGAGCRVVGGALREQQP